MDEDYMVTICAACRMASCWHGEWMCEASHGANVIDVPASVLRTEGREHPDYYSREKIRAVTGCDPDPVPREGRDGRDDDTTR